jgi:serine/threonine protein kinase
MIGKLISGRYLIEAGIGIGGMSRVWRARDEHGHGGRVALKQSRVELGHSDDLRTRLLREAEALRRIDHPGVVGVRGVVDSENELWLVMDYVEGISLKQHVAGGPLDEPEAARLGLETLEALRAVHYAGVWHRDIKPENILITRAGRIVLVDFGIAAIEGGDDLTRGGMMYGTVDYTAPERFSGAPANASSDLWSFGATLYRLVEDRSPFRRGNTAATMHAIHSERPHAAERLVELRPIIERLLAKNPAERPTINEARRALTDILTPQARRPQPVPGSIPGPLSRPRPGRDEAAMRAVRQSLAHGDLEKAASVVLALPGLQALLLLSDLKDPELHQFIERLCADPDRIAEILHRTTPDVSARLMSAAHDRRSVASVLRRLPVDRAGKILAVMPPRTTAAILESLDALGADYSSIVLTRPAREAATYLVYVPVELRDRIYDAAPTLWCAEARLHLRKLT